MARIEVLNAAEVPDRARVLVTPAPVEPGHAPLDGAGGAAGGGVPAPESPLPSAEAEPASYPLARFHEASPGASLLALASDGNRLVPQQHPDARTADGYLRLSAKILLEASKQSFRTIGVLSAREDEGRTAAAVNLAVCLGRAKGRKGRVLLVDGDARRRTLSRMFCGTGEVSTLDGTPAKHPMLIGTALEGVDLMTAPVLEDGLTISDPSAWRASFEDLGGVYPHILVDCPAVLENPEGLVLRECVQQLVLVARTGSTTRMAIQRTLGAFGSRVLGVVLHGATDASREESNR